MEESSRTALVRFLEEHAEAIVDRATDEALLDPEDTGPTRPREQVRENFVRFVHGHVTLLSTGNRRELEAFLRYVTVLRAKSRFPVSTMIRACFSVRSAVAHVLRREGAGTEKTLAMLEAIDEVMHDSTVLVSDMYAEELHRSLLERRAHLEAELRELTEQRLASLTAEREAMNALAAPILEVWSGILVLSLIGEFNRARVIETCARAVEHVATKGASVLLVDVTGFVSEGNALVDELGKLVASVRLVGAEAILVGVTPRAAKALASHGRSSRDMLSFATLRDGLSAAFDRAGLRVVSAGSPFGGSSS